MSIKTSIGWCERTWNPISGCSPCSESCINCYAARMAGTRLAHSPKYAGLTTRREEGSYKFTGEVRYHSGEIKKPLRWKKPSRIFVCSMADLFHDKMREGIAEWEKVYNIFWTMMCCPQHIFLVLTKRSQNMTEFFREWLRNFTTDDTDHIHWGITCENQKRYDERIQDLFMIRARIRYVSIEPVLSSIDLGLHEYAVGGSAHSVRRSFLSWVILGCETGPGRRKPEPEWIVSIVDQCAKAHVPIFMKDNLKPYWNGPLIQEHP